MNILRLALRPSRFTSSCLIRSLLLIGALAGPGSLAAGPGHRPFPRLAFYERFVAIDNVSGWPRLTLLPDGNLACLIWPHPVHGYTEGAVESWHSTDGGRLWHKRGVPVPHAPTTNRMNAAGGLTAAGDYIALIGGWDRRLHPAGWEPDPLLPPPPQGYFNKTGARSIDPVPAVSTDGGFTWRQFAAVSPLPPGRTSLIPFGRIAPVEGRTLGVMMYQRLEDATDPLDRRRSFFFVSEDDGATWHKRGQLPPGTNPSEATWLRLENGDLYAAVRMVYHDQHLAAFRSTDGGRTWITEGNLTLPNQNPADFTRLADGRILLTYGTRNEGDWAIYTRLADPDVHYWSAPLRLVDLEGSTNEPHRENPRRDGGYPSTVLLDDGTLVTVYYTRGVPAHQRYHVGVVRWALPPVVQAD